ncbi:MAG: hypothetical protein ACRDI2_03800 [Chloroflexota bacterium]
MSAPTLPSDRVVTPLVAASVVSVPVTLTHVIEDFSVGIHERFGLPLLLAAYLVASAYALQMLGAATMSWCSALLSQERSIHSSKPAGQHQGSA